ncbi:MAG TPA: Gmad2 immunoglobulin-like domain-containing protein, partial [Candidatus Limnocylindria bacterium]|nr:Gmad2 immunoglobulin-like domain-containing protein [Candidatus Limnocylindria bacterium]
EGDVATVDLRFSPEGWGVSGSSSTIALIQQIVYTATEEPGVRRVLVKSNGQPATIDQAVWTTALAREDVSFYDAVKSETVSETQSRPCAPTCPPLVPAVLSNNYSVDSFALGLARFVIQVDSGDWGEFTVSGGATNDGMNTRWSKYAIQIEVKGSEVKPGLEVVDRSPLRSIHSQNKGGSAFYELALDDHRPWRVALLANPDRIIVDIGGHPQALSDTVVVYSPKQGDIGRQFTVTGLSRTFEATTAWRVVDANRREIAGGFTTASRGTSAVWGTYQIAVQLPASVSGNVTLEVYWASPRDGADTGLVRVPLTVR